MPSRLMNFYTCRRSAWRARVEQGQEAVVEFDLPKGWRWTLRVVEISEDGVGFQLDEGRPELAPGMQLDDVTLDVGALQMMGSLRIAHVTKGAGADVVCGAAFTPASEADERMLALVVGALERRGERPR